MLATEYAAYFKIDPQRKDESDEQFKLRVSAVLRDKGKVIEAHEVCQDKLYDQSDAAMDGIIGAAAQAIGGRDYNVRGQAQIGVDIAAGIFSRADNPKPVMSREEAILALALFGKR